MQEFVLNSLFVKAFGYEPPEAFEIPEATKKATVSSFGSPYYANDVLGREMFLPVEFTTFKNVITPHTFIIVPFAVMSINCTKTIKSTRVVGGSGSTIESISIDDYRINIKGIAVSDDNSFPEAQIRDLHGLFLLNEPITLRSVLTDIFLNGKYDHHVVIAEMKWPGIASVENARPFEIECQADSIYDLINVN